MKLGFKSRKIYIKTINLINQFRYSYNYLKDIFYENSFKKIEPFQIRNLLTVQEGALGDTYNFIGFLNELSEQYRNINIYCLTRDKSKEFYKNPKLNVISKEEAEDMINKRKIDALITYGNLGNFFKNKRIVFNIPYRSGKLFPYKSRTVPEELILIFKKIGFKINKQLFYFTEKGEKAAKIFYEENNSKKRIIFLHAGCGRTVKALKEGKIAASLWPPENWAKVADYLIKKYNCTIILTGNEEEKIIVDDIIKNIKNKDNVINITGKFSIEEIASIVKRGDLAIVIDSGLMHVLSQTGIPIIILFSAYKPKVSGPHNSQAIKIFNKKVCNGCRKYYCPERNAACINSITVEEVLNNLPNLK